MKLQYKQELTTKSYFVNRFGKLSTSFLFWQIQDIAWEHAEKLGFGFDNLKEQKQFWVLSRLLVKIKRRPQWGEKFTVETWPAGVDGILALRDIRFLDENGDVIIKATTSWLVLDAESKRIIRMDELKDIPLGGERVFAENARKVKVAKPAGELIYSPALFNEIDINQHFNSGRYLERIIDSYSFEFHNMYELAEFEINFAKEGVPDDLIAVRKQKIDEHNHLCAVLRQSDEKELIRARLLWAKRK